ncbi:MAG: alpha/beta fold hydrolase [Cyclobacteriaceae bacterium]
MRIICFPFAGGSKYSYRPLLAAARDTMELLPLEYPGRGARLGERAAESLGEIVADAIKLVKDMTEGEPFAFYGHSMGALVAYLVAADLAKEALPQPSALFLTGRHAPVVEKEESGYHTLPKAALLQKIQELGGLPADVLGNEDLMDFFEPVIRGDFKALETFRFGGREPIDIPFHVLIGMTEKVTASEALAWQELTSLPLNFGQLTGDHFFIFRHPDRIIHWFEKGLDILAEKKEAYVNDKALTN